MYLTNILEYLEKTARELPDKTAFSDGDEFKSFNVLLNESKSIGTFLASEGYYKEPVVIFMNKHPDCLSAFFGVIYSGCFYVAIDSEMPQKRIELIFEKLSPRAVIYDYKNAERVNLLPENYHKYLFDDICKSVSDDNLLGEIRKKQIDTDPIYIVFTSGSTGVPKGVAACHRSVIDYTETLCEAVGFDRETVFGNQTPLYFDAPLKEIMPTIKLGATTYFIPKQLFMFPIKLCDYLNKYRINTVCWVVSALTMISSLGALEKNPPVFLRLICFGSEVFPLKQYELWRKTCGNARFFNLYGPTEATGMSCYWEACRELEPGEPIPIGKPFRNTEIMLLDENGIEAEPGSEGEICIRGTCVTLGYYNDSEKTSEAFVQNPLNRAYSELIYRTGDIGKINKHGELVFVSRKDSQIKHMGHRIELGEIESSILTCEGVRQTCCVYDAEKKRIISFYTGNLPPETLTKYLRDFLPRYMLPAKCVNLEFLPLTANGKLDRRKMSEDARNIEV